MFISTATLFMKKALDQAETALWLEEVPVGAILVYQGTVLSSAFNTCLRDNDSLAHAEIHVLRDGMQKLNIPYLTECDVYVTLEPCPLCAAALSRTRIRRVYFGAYDPKGGAVEHNSRVFATSLFRPEVIGGIRERECQSILQQFFERKRKKYQNYF